MTIASPPLQLLDPNLMSMRHIRAIRKIHKACKSSYLRQRRMLRQPLPTNIYMHFIDDFRRDVWNNNLALRNRIPARSRIHGIRSIKHDES